jgi:hypothetical protein
MLDRAISALKSNNRRALQRYETCQGLELLAKQ